MSHIVKNLLTLARADVDREGAVKRYVRFDEVLTQAFEQFRKVAVAKGVGLDITKSAPVCLRADPLRLGQVVYNLIDNAVKYTPKGGRVGISLEEERSSAILKVKDTGIGIAPEDMPYIFDRFYRVDKSRGRDGGGVGLGLSICKEIVESMGGTIGAESAFARGTIFTVRFPLAVKDKNGEAI